MSDRDDAQPSPDAPAQPGPAHAALDVFVGRWSTHARLVDDEGRPAGEFVGTDAYEWLPGGFFLLHRVAGRMEGAEVHVLEIVGWDAARGVYTTRSYDNGGNAATYEARLEGRAWSIDGASERFAGAFGEDGRTLEGRWERRAADGRWVRWMEIRLERDG